MYDKHRIYRVRVVSALDAFGTGTVSGVLAVTIASRDGLGALGMVLSVRLLAAVVFALWARRATSGSGTLPPSTLAPSVFAMTAASVLAVALACTGATTVVCTIAYFCFTATNAATGLHVSSRSPGDAVRLSSLNGIMIAASSTLAAVVFAAAGVFALLAVAVVAVSLQLAEIPLLRTMPPVPHDDTTAANSTLTWGVVAAAVAFVAYAPLALAAGITTREFGAAWVAPVVLLYAAASLAAPAVHRRIGMLPWWTVGVWLAASNLMTALIPLGIGAYVLGRVVSSGLMFAVDGTVRLRAFADGGTRALVAVGTGTTIGLSAAIPVYGVLADRTSTATTAVIFAALAGMFSMVLRLRLHEPALALPATPAPAPA